jgi:putative phage-type endonuclease
MSALTLPKAEIVCEGAEREDWLALRRIGGSDIAAILEIEGAWGSPLSVYLDKIGEGAPFRETIYTDSGNWYEQRAAERFSHLSGIETIQPPPITMYASKALPIATASPDRLTADGSAWVEIKWVGSHRSPEWTDAPPPHYEAQVKWGLAVSGLDVGYLFAEIGGQDPRWFEIEHDQAWADRAFEEAESFWQLVESRTAPEADGSETSKRAIAYRYSEVDPDPIEGGYELALAIADLLDVQQAAKSSSAALTKAENAVKLILREHETGTVDGQTVVTWKEQSRRGLDLDAVRSLLGSDVSKYEKATPFRVLRIAKGAK